MIQVLQIGRAVESSVLNYTALYESSVTNRKDATRAMDQLCQRIMASMQFQPHHGINRSGTGLPSDSSIRSSFASMQLSDISERHDLPPSPPISIGSPCLNDEQFGVSHHTHAMRYSSDVVGQRERCFSPRVLPSAGTNSQVDQGNYGPISERSQRSNLFDDDQMWHQIEGTSLQGNRNSSITYFAQEFGRSSANLGIVGISSSKDAHYQQPLSNSGLVTRRQPSQQTQRASIPMEEVASPLFKSRKLKAVDSSNEMETNFSWPGTINPHLGTTKNEAPEVVTSSFEGLNPTYADHPQFSDKCLAQGTQVEYSERLIPLAKGIEMIWIPLQRPALHNRYHGFCKGAWQIRKAVRYSQS